MPPRPRPAGGSHSSRKANTTVERGAARIVVAALVAAASAFGATAAWASPDDDPVACAVEVGLWAKTDPTLSVANGGEQSIAERDKARVVRFTADASSTCDALQIAMTAYVGAGWERGWAEPAGRGVTVTVAEPATAGRDGGDPPEIHDSPVATTTTAATSTTTDEPASPATTTPPVTSADPPVPRAPPVDGQADRPPTAVDATGATIPAPAAGTTTTALRVDMTTIARTTTGDRHVDSWEPTLSVKSAGSEILPGDGELGGPLPAEGRRRGRMSKAVGAAAAIMLAAGAALMAIASRRDEEA